jgi:hypothetical protein
MTPVAILDSRRELARRVSGGIEVALFRSAKDNSTTVEVRQAATDETLLITVARADALDAFYHPFAHLPPTAARLVWARD